MSRLDLPSCKLAISDLSNSRICHDIQSNIQGSTVWISGKRTFEVLWIQGNVITNVLNSRFEINDSTGNAEIVLTDSVASACNTISSGMYVMVVGQLLEVEEGRPIVRAMKIQDLSDRPALKSMWPYEVKDLS